MMNQTKQDGLLIGGVAHATIRVPREEAHKVVIEGMGRNPDGRSDPGFLREDDPDTDEAVFEAYLHNAFVNQGLQGLLDSAYGDLVSDQITHIGLSGDASAVTLTTTDLDPGAAGNSIKTTANTSRTGQTVSTDQTWTEADVNFAIKKIGLLRGALSTDVSNIIGGDGGAAPFDEPFTIDLTNITSWTLTMGVDVTASAS